ncbi:PREDICTED: ubiquitin carboxyl-terminal hydrolase 26 [Galeopterus variegatus]|uniref:Ubiquitin carboxyl-terminal hydrolase n=1 Tax=Galeopterus variegatus TaxID=482537 RepID=A0ABM0RKZ7_GALVR|nr:PREDICTED: ubiquitin carboxyl-terminal hydrolase 26 [Galeopterus variegatus]
MVALLVHGFVQTWSMETGMAMTKEAFIETVERKRKVYLVLHFGTDEFKTFQLSNNIRSVVHASYGENQNFLLLTLKNNTCLFIERLLSTDAKQLKIFLDRVHQNKLHPPMGPGEDGDVFASSATQKVNNKTSFDEVCKKSSNGSFETTKGSGMPVLHEMTLFTSESSISVCNSTGNPSLGGTGLLRSLTQKIFLAFLLKQKYSKDYPEWQKFETSFGFYSGSLWQGLPNLGNTCYMNAVLQSLFSIPSFTDDLLNHNFPWGELSRDNLTMCLIQLLLLRDIYDIKIKREILVSIKAAISAVADIFSDNIQNDAHEFLSHCLDQMKENMRKLNIIWKTKSESSEENSPQQGFAGNAATKVLICPVTSNFEFELLLTIICKGCGQAVLKTELNNSLSLNLPQGAKALPLSVQSTFDFFFKAEELEYNCKKCKHKSSVAVHKFTRLPRVLILHLKRYSLNENWSLKKDDQQVIISKYLKLSSHCSENTKPPIPLSKNVCIRDIKVVHFFQNMICGVISSLTSSTKLTLESKDSLAQHIGSDKKSQPQCQRFFKGASREEQQKDLEKYSKRNDRESNLRSDSIHLGDWALIVKELLAGSGMNLEDTSLSLIHKDGDKPNSRPDTSVAEIHPQEVPENSKLEKYKTDSDSVIEPTEDFYKDKDNRIVEKLRNVAEQIQQCKGMRICKQAPRHALPRSLPKPDSQGNTENLGRPTELSVQEANVNSLLAFGSNKNPGNKDILGNKKTESNAKQPKKSADKEDLHTYRLIGVISHLGDTPDSGHYVSNAYNFEKQAWFHYNDLVVSGIREALMQQDSLCSGYLFFYMHDGIFEELLERGKNSQLHSTELGNTPQEK